MTPTMRHRKITASPDVKVVPMINAFEFVVDDAVECSPSKINNIHIIKQCYPIYLLYQLVYLF